MKARARAAAVAEAPAGRLLAIGVITVAAIGALLAVALLHRPSSTADLAQGPINITRSLSPTAALFGDPVKAEIDVYTSDGSIPPESVRLRTNFAPYRVVTRKVDRGHQGGVSLLRTRLTLQCLARACLPSRRDVRTLEFAPAAVAYSTDDGATGLAVPWPKLQVSSRLPIDLTSRTDIVDTPPPLETSFRRSPELLRVLLLGAAALLGLAGAFLVVTTLWPRSFLSRRRWRRLSPLERSLAEVEAAAGSGDEAVRRQTLDRLATHLGAVPSQPLEEETRALAWGEHPPEPEALTLLAAQVRTALNGGVHR